MKALGPDVLPEPTPDIVMAYRAMARGTASAGQQRAVMRHLLADLCGVLVADGANISDRAAGFTAGKRWVGLTTASLAGLTVLAFPGGDD